MKKNMREKIKGLPGHLLWPPLLLVSVLALLLLASCGNGKGHSETYSEGEEHKNSLEYRSSHDKEAHSFMDRLPTLAEYSESMESFPLPEDYHTTLSEKFIGVEGATFLVKQRTPEMNKFPCAQCHILPVDDLKKESAAFERNTHFDITLSHAPESVMTCATCHGVDEPGSGKELKTLVGDPVSLNAAYQVCSQCHSPQFKDWVGGAHGKRVGGWVEPRISVSCTECHDPHGPANAFSKRWPAYNPRMKF